VHEENIDQSKFACNRWDELQHNKIRQRYVYKTALTAAVCIGFWFLFINQ